MSKYRGNPIRGSRLGPLGVEKENTMKKLPTNIHFKERTQADAALERLSSYGFRVRVIEPIIPQDDGNFVVFGWGPRRVELETARAYAQAIAREFQASNVYL